MSRKIVIVGGGVAGLSAAEAARKKDKDAEITVLTTEDVPPYYRIQLSHMFHENKPVEKLLVRSPSWYKENRIDLQLEQTVKEILPEKKIVHLEDGSSLPYDTLIIATGAYNFIPPFAQKSKRVTSIRTHLDVKELRSFLKPQSKVVIVGGGLLGLEAAYSLYKAGMRVSVVEVSTKLIPKQADKKAADMLKKALEDAGVDLHLGNSVTSLEEKDESVKVTLGNNKELGADLVLFSIGVRPEVSFAKAAGFQVNRGIVVNEKMETSIPDIYACGDCSECNGITNGLWTSAMKQGAVAGTNAAGGNVIYTPWVARTMFTSFGLNFFSIGEIVQTPKENEEVITLKETDDSFARLYLKDNKIIGALLFNTKENMAKISKMVEDKDEYIKES